MTTALTLQQEELGRITATVTLRLKQQEAMRARGVVTFTMRDWQQYREHAMTIQYELNALLDLLKSGADVEIPEGYRDTAIIKRMLADAAADEQTADKVVEAITQAAWNL